MADTMLQAQEDIIRAYGAAQRRAQLQASIIVDRLWRELALADLTGSWQSGPGPAIVRAVAASQMLAASTGQSYVNAMVAADSLSSDYEPDASRVVTRSFSGVAADGRALDSLLYQPVIHTKVLIKGGMTPQAAKLGGLVNMQRIVASEIGDAGRGAAGVAMAANRTVTGYVRTVRAGACSRCVILAGRWYKYNADFQRHKRCQCYGVPATSARPGRRTDPTKFFNGLSRAEQDRRFTAAGAQAIRDGANINRVVNARRGMSGIEYSSHSRSNFLVREATGTARRRVTDSTVTTESTRRGTAWFQNELERAYQRSEISPKVYGSGGRGWRPQEERRLLSPSPGGRLTMPGRQRWTPEYIYQVAASRADIIRLLRFNGYIV